MKAITRGEREQVINRIGGGGRDVEINGARLRVQESYLEKSRGKFQGPISLKLLENHPDLLQHATVKKKNTSGERAFDLQCNLWTFDRYCHFKNFLETI